MIVTRFINDLMSSNCYIVEDEISHSCIIIDPGSVESKREIEHIRLRNFDPIYIIISHEHTDHNWGVNALREAFPNVKLVCSEECSKNVSIANKAYFLFYYDDTEYSYEISPSDIIIKENQNIVWSNNRIKFYITPGHSFGSMCIGVNGYYLFTGDTIMPYNPYFNGRDSNEDDWLNSISLIERLYGDDTIIYPGHGDSLSLGSWAKGYKKL